MLGSNDLRVCVNEEETQEVLSSQPPVSVDILPKVSKGSKGKPTNVRARLLNPHYHEGGKKKQQIDHQR